MSLNSIIIIIIIEYVITVGLLKCNGNFLKYFVYIEARAFFLITSMQNKYLKKIVIEFHIFFFLFFLDQRLQWRLIEQSSPLQSIFNECVFFLFYNHALLNYPTGRQVEFNRQFGRDPGFSLLCSRLSLNNVRIRTKEHEIGQVLSKCEFI